MNKFFEISNFGNYFPFKPNESVFESMEFRYRFLSILNEHEKVFSFFLSKNCSIPCSILRMEFFFFFECVQWHYEWYFKNGVAISDTNCFGLYRFEDFNRHKKTFILIVGKTVESSVVFFPKNSIKSKLKSHLKQHFVHSGQTQRIRKYLSTQSIFSPLFMYNFRCVYMLQFEVC